MNFFSSRSEELAVTMESQSHVLIIGAGITGLLLAQTLKIRKYPLPYTSATPTHITVAQDGALRLTGRKAHCWICYLKPSKTDSWRRTWILRPLRRETVGDSRYSTSRMAKGCSRIYLIIGSECQEND
jgi:hypothetical protein